MVMTGRGAAHRLAHKLIRGLDGTKLLSRSVVPPGGRNRYAFPAAGIGSREDLFLYTHFT